MNTKRAAIVNVLSYLANDITEESYIPLVRDFESLNTVLCIGSPVRYRLFNNALKEYDYVCTEQIKKMNSKNKDIWYDQLEKLYDICVYFKHVNGHSKMHAIYEQYYANYTRVFGYTNAQ